jgi:hypothetical protein
MARQKGLNITLARKTGAAAALARIAGLGKLAAYVGIPSASTRSRSQQLLEMAGEAKSKKKQARLKKAAESDVTNAELLFIFSKGSPLRKQPARPVLEPAIEFPANKKIISRELAASCKASIAGDHALAVRNMKRAALAGQNAARGWFVNPANNWAPNAPSTIKRKGSDRPGIDTGAMRAAIVGIVEE